MASGQKFLVKNLTDWVYHKYNSRKILGLLQLAHFVGVIRDNSESLEADFTKQ